MTCFCNDNLTGCVRLLYWRGREARVNTKVDYSGPLEHSGPINRPLKPFGYADLKTATKKFSMRNVLDSDNPNFTVYKGVLASGEIVRVRKTPPATAQQRLSEQCEAELKILSRVHHRNLVSLVGFCFEGREHILVYEFLANGTLNDHLHDLRRPPFSWKRILEISHGVASGIAHLHGHTDPPIVHRNISSASILLGNKFVAKVSEFGLSKQVSDLTEDSRSTSGFMPPEAYSTRRSTEKSDVFSFGVVLLELVTRLRAYDIGRRNGDEIMLVNLMRKAYEMGWVTGVLPRLDPSLRPTELFGSLDKQLRRYLKLALRCVKDEPTFRPTMSYVVGVLQELMEGGETQANISVPT